MAKNNSDSIKKIENLSKLIEENHRLNESIYEDTGIEKFNKMIDDTVRSYEKLQEVSKNFGDLKDNLSFDNISKELKNLNEEINEGKKKLKEYNKTLSDNQKELDECNEIIKELRKNGKDVSDELIERQKELGKQVEESQKKVDECTESLDKNKDKYEGLYDASSKYYSNVNKQQKELNRRQVEGITVLDDYKEKWDQKTKAIKNGVGKIKEGFKDITDGVKNMFGPWSKANQEAFNYARTVGMSKETTQKFLSDTTSWAAKNDIGILFNKTTEELIKMQSKYSEVLGRNVQLSGEQKKDMLAMEKFIGEEGMMDIANNLENFGLGMSDSADFVKKTLDEATKSGISASKLTKTIRENIKMAQNYTFKNGLDGLTSMAKKAIQLKTDLSLVSSFAEKTSTVEGAISTGAQLQVLGGSYAMGSDPLSMMYESLSDTEGLFDRAVNMAKGKVFYNEKTGNFEMGAMDRYLMKQAATTMGIDPSKLIDVAYRQASLGKIESQIGLNKNISDDKDMVEMVKNLATWDKGEAFVTIDGKQKNVKDLSVDDKSKLEAMGRTDSENLQDMAINLRSITEIMDGTKKEKENEQANLLNGIGNYFHDLLNKGTNLLDIISKIGAWGGTIFGGFSVVSGLLISIRGILTTTMGVGNLFGGKRGGVGAPGMMRGKGGAVGAPGMMGGKGGAVGAPGMMRGNVANAGKTGGFFKSAGTSIKSGAKSSWKFLKGGGKFSGGLGAVGGGLIGAGLSLGSDLMTGDYKKNKNRSLGNAAAIGIGSAVGGIFGPLGAIAGGAIAGITTSVVEKYQKENREKFRKKIVDGLDSQVGFLSSLFVGENSLVGDYNQKELLKIKNALSDKVLSKGEMSNYLIEKLEANGDLDRIKNLGYEVKMAEGGLLKGNSHSEGGMPILGSNVTVEGGEFVVNKDATKNNLPLLNKINNGDYNMTPKEPLGKQMQVQEKTSSNNNHINGGKVDINPISINLSGTIKLDAGGTQFNITEELTKNPHLITKITELISKELNILNYGAFNKGNYKQKFA